MSGEDSIAKFAEQHRILYDYANKLQKMIDVEYVTDQTDTKNMLKTKLNEVNAEIEEVKKKYLTPTSTAVGGSRKRRSVKSRKHKKRSNKKRSHRRR
jgi:methyltransferase-like protein